jgi:hypothetical protein
VDESQIEMKGSVEMAFEKVKRNIYYYPDRLQLSTGNRKDVESQSELDCLEPDHIGKNHYQDFEEFHLPMDRMHNSNLHDWGVARGLEVKGTIGGGEVIINPGVAIDIDGQLISLSDTGHGDTGENPPGGKHKEVPVPVKLSTEYSAGMKVYVTIQFSEILRSDQGAAGMKEQVPWVRLQSIDSYISEKNNGSKSIILAVAVINDNGKLAELKAKDDDLPNCRRLIGESVEELRIQRSGNAKGTVQDILSGKVGPGDEGGLKITVPDANDSVLFARENGGDFKSLGINGNVSIGTTNPSARLEVNGNIKADASELGTLVVKGNVGIGTTDPDCALHVNGTKIKLGPEKEGQLLIAGENNFLFLEANGSNDTGTVSELTICGNSTRNIPTLKLSADNTFFGGSITVPGIINSNQNLLVQGNVGIGTTTPSAKLNVDPQGRGGIVIGNPNTSAGGYTSLIMEISEEQDGYASLNCLKSSGSSSGDICLNPQGRNVGIGTTNPSARLEVDGDIKGKANLVIDGNIGIGATNPEGTLSIPHFRMDKSEASPNAGYIRFGDSSGWKFHIGRERETVGGDFNTGTNGVLMTVCDSGNVGIGTINPSAKLDIQGATRINDNDIWLRGGTDCYHGIGWYGYGKPFADDMSIDGPVVFGYKGGALGTNLEGSKRIALRWDYDGNVYVRGTLRDKQKDLAENYPSEMDLESGDVICLAQDKDRIVISEKPNDPLVLGVVSTKPGFLLNDGEDAKETNLFPVALCGCVPCKVVDENGPIKRGDLLTSSSTPGHAMKASPIKDGEFFSPGTIIGKAIGTLESGRGVIDIFVLSR